MKYSTFATILLALGPIARAYANNLPYVSTGGSYVLQPGETLVITPLGAFTNIVITNTLNIPITTMVPSAPASAPLTFLPFSGLSTSPGSLTAVAAPSTTDMLSTTRQSDSSTGTRSGNDQFSSSISTLSYLTTQTSASSITNTRHSSASATAVTIIILPTTQPFKPHPSGPVFLPNLTVSTGGLCGHDAGQTCMMSPFGSCCGPNNTCGNSDIECGSGCQENYGGCNMTLLSVSATSSTKRASISTSSPSSSTLSTVAPTATLDPSSTSETPSGSSPSISSPSSTSSLSSTSILSTPTNSSGPVLNITTTSSSSSSAVAATTSSPTSSTTTSSMTSTSSTSSSSSSSSAAATTTSSSTSSSNSSSSSTTSSSGSSSSSSSVATSSSSSSISSVSSFPSTTGPTSSLVLEVTTTVIPISTISGPVSTVTPSSLPSLTTSSLPLGFTVSQNVLRNLTLEHDGRCGPQAQSTCLGSPFGECCGANNTCGWTDAACGIGKCQPLYGICNLTDFLVVNDAAGRFQLFVSYDGSCGPDVNMTCYQSGSGDCCGPSNSCGNASDFCYSGCQPAFGRCDQPPPQIPRQQNVRLLRRGRHVPPTESQINRRAPNIEVLQPGETLVVTRLGVGNNIVMTDTLSMPMTIFVPAGTLNVSQTIFVPSGSTDPPLTLSPGSLTIFPTPTNAGSSGGSAAPSSNNNEAPSSTLWLLTTTITGGPQTSSSVFVIDIDPSETTSSSLPVLTASPNILLNLSKSQVGVCGAFARQSCLGSIWGDCCGPLNLCGNTTNECRSGICQYQYGLCAVTDVPTVTVDPSTASPAHMPSFTLSNSVAPTMPPNLTRSSLVKLNLSTSTLGECGADVYTGEVHGDLTCLGSPFGQCCGANGTCGYTMDAHCGKGVCQYLYGLCAAEDYITVTISSGSSSPTSTSALVTHMLFISSDGGCGPPGVTCLGSTYGDCCNYAGACSNASGFCQPPGCQPDFGRCDPPAVDRMHKRTVRVLRPARYMPRRRDW